jgi:hypothetical protein
MYLKKQQRRSAVITGAGTTLLVTGFLLAIIVLPGLLKRPPAPENTLSESGNFRDFWEAHRDEVIWWEEKLYADQLETELSDALDSALHTPASSSPVVLHDNLADVLGSHNGYYAVLPVIGFSFDSLKSEIYQGKTLSEWKELAEGTNHLQEAYPDEEKLATATQYLNRCQSTILSTYTVQDMTLADLSAEVERLSLSSLSQDQDECLRLKTLLGEAIDRAYEDPIFDGRSYNELCKEVKDLQEAKILWEKEQLSKTRNETYLHHENLQKAFRAIIRSKQIDLFSQWNVPYYLNIEYDVYVLFMTEETIRELSTLGCGDTTMPLIRCDLSFASYELDPDLITPEMDTTQETEESPSDSYAMSDTELQAFLQQHRDEIRWSQNRYFVSYSGIVYPYEDYFPHGYFPQNNPSSYHTFEIASELYDHWVTSEDMAPYYAVWFRPFETKASDFTWTITTYLDRHAIPYYTGSATGTHEWKEVRVNFTMAFLTLDEIVALYEANSKEKNPFAIMAFLPQDMMEAAGFDTEGTMPPETDSTVTTAGDR